VCESWSVIRITSVCEEVREGDPRSGKLSASVENAAQNVVWRYRQSNHESAFERCAHLTFGFPMRQ